MKLNLIRLSYSLELLHRVKHGSVWGEVCRKHRGQVDELFHQLKSQSTDNPKAMKEILGDELFNFINFTWQDEKYYLRN